MTAHMTDGVMLPEDQGCNRFVYGLSK